VRIKPLGVVAVAASALTVLVGGGANAIARESGWAPRVTNPWFPLRPGTTYVYTGMRDGHPSRELFTVTRSTKVIQGVRCTAVFDRLYLRGRLFERTTDWYAQDRRGAVWYFGERTAELDANGHVTSTEGSWQSGVDGAKAGIYMSAHPRVGQSFRQELYPGHADDRFAVVSLKASVSVPYVTSHQALLTKEWTPLEPGVLDHKLYVRGIGTVKEETVKGGSERNVLVAVRHG